jgi:hypothetical protein
VHPQTLDSFPGQPCAKAGVQGLKRRDLPLLDSRFRGNDEKKENHAFDIRQYTRALGGKICTSFDKVKRWTGR